MQVTQIPDPVLPLLSFPVISFIVSVDKTWKIIPCDIILAFFHTHHCKLFNLKKLEVQ